MKKSTQKHMKPRKASAGDLKEFDVHGKSCISNGFEPKKTRLPPFQRRASTLRRALIEAVSEEDIRQIACKLIDNARRGEVMAAREIMARCIGNAGEAELRERVDTLEDAISLLLQRLPTGNMRGPDRTLPVIEAEASGVEPASGGVVGEHIDERKSPVGDS